VDIKIRTAGVRMAGYSKRTLVEKLGIQHGFNALVLNPPSHYFILLGTLPPKVTFFTQLKPSLDFIHYFSTDRRQYQRDLPQMKKAIAPHGMIWISWPKQSSGIQSDLSEKDVRMIALREKLVDIKVCAVDDTWSGLKLVIPVKFRPEKKKA
jgi:hypothetical protein